jgi:hypothetical protein
MLNARQNINLKRTVFQGIRYILEVRLNTQDLTGNRKDIIRLSFYQNFFLPMLIIFYRNILQGSNPTINTDYTQEN